MQPALQLITPDAVTSWTLTCLSASEHVVTGLFHYSFCAGQAFSHPLTLPFSVIRIDTLYQN